MELLYVALGVILLARANGDEYNLVNEIGEKWPTDLVLGKRPYKDTLDKIRSYNAINNELHDLLRGENFDEKYSPRIHRILDNYVPEQKGMPIREGDTEYENWYDPRIKYEVSDEEVEDSSLDVIVDFLLGMVSKEIVAKGKDQIPVPDMSEEFEKRVAFVTLHGKFDAHDGWFKNVSTIQRTGDVVVTRRGFDTLVISCELGLAVMQFGFQSYAANLAGLSVRGHMTGSVASNSVSLQVAVSVDGGRCNITLEKLQMDRFDGLDVELTGLGSLSWLLNSIAGWATRHFKDNIVSSIENNLRTTSTGIIAKYHCDQHMYLLQGYLGNDISVVNV